MRKPYLCRGIWTPRTLPGQVTGETGGSWQLSGKRGGRGTAPATLFGSAAPLGHRHHRASRSLERQACRATETGRSHPTAGGGPQTGNGSERQRRKDRSRRRRSGKMAATKRKRRGDLAVPAKRPKRNDKGARPPAKQRDKAEDAEEEDRNCIPGPVCKVEGATPGFHLRPLLVAPFLGLPV